MDLLRKINKLRKISKQIRLKIGLDSFALALIGVIVLAYFEYSPGIYEGKFTLHDVGDYGIMLIFFFYGLKLNPKQLKKDLSNWKLHLVIQIATFILFPLIVLLFMGLFGNYGNKLFWIGIFYLAALPSTVSSSVVMVSIARGNVPSAIFNASVSSLLGVFITPIWMGIILTSGGGSYDVTNVIIKLSLQVLLPVTVGILLHSKFGKYAHKHSNILKKFDQSVILLIVYLSFCESFAHKMFSGYGITELFLLGWAMVVFFFIIYGIITLISRFLHFNKEDYITAVFCGSKKSLVHGTVMANILFSEMVTVGVILLPLMMFHALQLVIASMIAQKFSKRENIGHL